MNGISAVRSKFDAHGQVAASAEALIGSRDAEVLFDLLEVLDSLHGDLGLDGHDFAFG